MKKISKDFFVPDCVFSFFSTFYFQRLGRKTGITSDVQTDQTKLGKQRSYWIKLRFLMTKSVVLKNTRRFKMY